MNSLALFQEGATQHQSGHIEQAIACYRKALALDPAFPEALHLLGVGLFQQGDCAEAIRLIEQAILLSPTQADFYNNLAEIHATSGDPLKAFFTYRQALLLDQQHPQASQGVQQLRNTHPNLPVFRNLEQLNHGMARHTFPTLALSQDDELHQPTDQLIQLALKAAKHAKNIDLSAIAKRFDAESATYIQLWPGEHYKLLAAFVKILQPKLIIEIGTATGASALALKKFLPKKGKIVTYDVIPWNQYPGSGLAKDDFDQHLEQRIVDLSNPVLAETQRDDLAKADIVFVDAAKDGLMEHFFCAFFESVKFAAPCPLFVFDDIRMPVMLELWRSIKHPKLDFTSLGHWSGTGLVLWK